MTAKFELLAPGGDIDSIKAAIVAGADAIYCGLDSFNARNRAKNISFDELNGLLTIAHNHDCKIFLTLNIIILEPEIPSLIRLLNQLVNTRLDGVIVQDLGLFYLLSTHFQSLEVHASTQVTTHNKGQLLFLNKLAASRANLSRELNISEIKSLTKTAHKNNIATEVFVHGSNCIGFSGLCYISSATGGNSGNRGRCSQPCRDQYKTTRVGVDHPLNIKDNSAFFDIEELSDAKVDSLKIEGRVKKPHYVYTVVNSWKNQLNNFYQNNDNADNTDLYKVFNRDFSNSFLKGDIDKNMFIDNPRDNSVKHFVREKNLSSDDEILSVKKDLYDEKTDIIHNVIDKTKDLIIDKALLSFQFSGSNNSPLRIIIKSNEKSFEIVSQHQLIKADKPNLDADSLTKRFKAVNTSRYEIDSMDFDGLEENLFLPFKELTILKNKMMFLLNDSIEIIPPIVLPKLTNKRVTEQPKLSVLISSIKDLPLCDLTSASIYYQLPDCLSIDTKALIQLFSDNKKLVPWFPSIIIGDDYAAAIEFLEQVRPKQIVSNNTGVAFHAYKMGIDWIAGPYLNLTNSYSLLSLKESFNCSGAFISNEINKNQIRPIKCPDNFQLHYSVYHPILLLTSRQCLFHQTIGCKKAVMDDECLLDCKKSTSIINLKETSYMINKKRSEYNSMYSQFNYLNTDIITEENNNFSHFMIDLRTIKTATKLTVNKLAVIETFESILEGETQVIAQLHEMIPNTTQVQYKKGL